MYISQWDVKYQNSLGTIICSQNSYPKPFWGINKVAVQTIFIFAPMDTWFPLHSSQVVVSIWYTLVLHLKRVLFFWCPSIPNTTKLGTPTITQPFLLWHIQLKAPVANSTMLTLGPFQPECEAKCSPPVMPTGLRHHSMASFGDCLIDP